MLPVPQAGIPPDLTPWHMFATADIVVKLVMILLALASVATWTVLFAKLVELRAVGRRLRAQLQAVAAAPSLGALDALGAEPMRLAAQDELGRSRGLPPDGTKERVARRLSRIEAANARRLTRGTGVLAIIGSVGPFVGLFGTVWGIMNSFVGIARMQTTNLAVVAPGIAEALLATAAGLVAAVPAVVIYNVFARLAGGCRALSGDLASAVWALASRDLDRDASTHAPLAVAAE